MYHSMSSYLTIRIVETVLQEGFLYAFLPPALTLFKRVAAVSFYAALDASRGRHAFACSFFCYGLREVIARIFGPLGTLTPTPLLSVL